MAEKTMVKVKLTRNIFREEGFCEIGKVITLEGKYARELINAKKAVEVKEESPAPPEQPEDEKKGGKGK